MEQETTTSSDISDRNTRDTAAAQALVMLTTTSNSSIDTATDAAVAARGQQHPLPRSTPPAQKLPAKAASVRSPNKGAASLRQPLRIDVSPPADLGAIPIALTSPLGLFATKKLPASSHRSHPAASFSGAESRSSAQLFGTPFLEYGMVVALSCDDRGGIVAAEGYASRDVRLERVSYNVELNGTPPKLGLGGHEERKMFEDGGFRLTSCPYRDCLFEVVPKMTYDATLALDALETEICERRGSLSSGDGSSQSHQQHSARLRDQNLLADLKFKSDAELRLNATMYKKLRGVQVIYGQVVTWL